MKDLSDRRILLVDDTKTNIDVLIQALREHYRLGVALDGYRALEYAGRQRPDLILLDILMPGMDGFAVCRNLKADPMTRDIPIIFITARDKPSDKTAGFEMGAVDYIVKPFDVTEVRARVKTHLMLKSAREALASQNALLEEKVYERTRELEDIQVEILERLGLAAEYRDEKTGNHIKRVSEYCRLLGRSAGLDENACRLLALAATMHDVGKIGIPDLILQKSGGLTEAEYAIMKTHTTIGARMLSGSRYQLLQTAEIIALTHHERWDGKGYMSGASGENIPLFGRIVCVCDVFDALISERPYKRSWPVAEALAEIRRGAGTHFDPDLAALFVDLAPQVSRIVEKLS